MISLIVKDGLGNQMFEYAFTRYVQHVIGGEEKIIINPYYIDHYDFRKVSLQNFILNPNIIFLEPEEQVKNMRMFQKRVLVSNGFDVFNWKIRKKKPLGRKKFEKRAKKGLYYTYTPFTNYGVPWTNEKNKFVFGCFQGEDNFKPIKDIICEEFELKTVPSKENEELIKRIKSTESVCLHIRRGDYLNAKWKNLQVCTYEYYNNAINEVVRNVEDPVFYVFSNTHEDIEWIKNKYIFRNYVNDTPLRLIYVDLNNPDYEELRLMKSCKHFIISNSTFSWWAAYLGKHGEKIVYAPDRWNLSLDDDTSIYPREWRKISTR